MNSPMRGAGPGQTPGGRFTEDPLPRQRPPTGPANDPVVGLVIEPVDGPVTTLWSAQWIDPAELRSTAQWISRQKVWPARRAGPRAWFAPAA